MVEGAVVPSKTTGDVVPSCVIKDAPGNFFPAELEVGKAVSANFHSVSAVNFSQSALRNFVKERASRSKDGVWLERDIVRPNGGPCHIREECPLRRVISGEEGWPWEASGVGRSWFATASCKLLIAPSRASPLVTALSSPVLENQEGWWALKSPSTIWSPWPPPEGHQSLGCSSEG